MKKNQKGEFLSSRVRYIPINAVRPNPQQPRRSFDETALQELADSISAYGILQPRTGAASTSWWRGSAASAPPASPDCGRFPASSPRWGRRTRRCWR